MTYSINYLSGKKNPVAAFTYNSTLKTLVPTASRFEFETGADFMAIKVDGDYVLFHDDESGLLCGDMITKDKSESPRIEIIENTCGIKQRIASITQTGALVAKTVEESASLPAESMNLLDRVSFSKAGVFTNKVNEVWLMTDEGGNYVMTEGKFIRVRI